MKSSTGTIIAALAALLLCCLGLILSSFGVLAVATPPPPGTTYSASAIVYVAICLGALFMLGAVVLGFLTWRRRRTAVLVQPGTASAAATPTAAPAPASIPKAVFVPAPASVAAAAPPAPVVSAVSGNPMAQDASTQAVRDAIMALNRPSAPYQILDGKAKGVDLIAEWKIVDAQWYEIFAKANLSKVFRIYMKFDPAKREVRAMDEELSVSWKQGVPSLSAEASFFRGQKSSISFGTGYAFTENLSPGQVYKYKFNTNELKKPIQDAIAACGWTYKGVAYGKL